VDGKSLVTYLSLLFLSLVEEGTSSSSSSILRCEEADRWPPLADPLFTGGLSGSPVKSPAR